MAIDARLASVRDIRELYRKLSKQFKDIKTPCSVEAFMATSEAERASAIGALSILE